jgi:hypothetical protein
VRVLVACEFSGTVRDAFRRAGHDAMSCDLEPSERPGPHYIGDVRDVLDDGWDMMIAFPPCTFLAVSGARWFEGDVPVAQGPSAAGARVHRRRAASEGTPHAAWAVSQDIPRDCTSDG